MKNLLKSFLFIIVALFVADRVGGGIMWWINQHTQDITGPKLKYLSKDVDDDVIFLGTSRSNFHYVPCILSDSLCMSVYNGGIDASDCIYAHYFVLNMILLHKTPTLIGLELMTNDYCLKKDDLTTISFFAPYMGMSKNADSLFRLAGTYLPYCVSHLYRYNAKAVSNMAGLFVNRQANADHGYIPGAKPAMFPEIAESEHASHEVDTLKLHYLRKFITLCRERNITLIFTVSPRYTIADADLYDPLKRIAAEYGVPFFDYHTQGLYLDHPEYFRDPAHLWDKGARLYTAKFAHDLKLWLSCGRMPQ